MSIIAVCALAIVAVALILLLKQQKPVFSFAILVLSSAFIIYYAISIVGNVIEPVEEMIDKAGINSNWIAILIKSLGICYVTQFAADCCRDASETTLANGVELFGKITVLLLALPILGNVVEAIFSLIS